ncbi:UNVERIFIED_CONTAM: hypothetical protein RMT77_013652 [Armadillidium vulgare]
MDFERDLALFAENDLKELLDSDYYAEALRAAGELDLSSIIEGSYPCNFSPSGGNGGGGGVVLNDRLITEASMGLISHLGSLTPLSSFFPSRGKIPNSIPIKSEHSYSMSDEGNLDLQFLRPMDDELSDLESECYPTVSLTEAEGSRAPEKPPLFSKPLQNNNNNNENNDGGSSFLESSPPLQRHLSTETLSCCGDCGCVPEEEVLDLNTDISTSPFPLIELNEVSDENEGADLGEEENSVDGKDPLSNEPHEQVPKQSHSQELQHRLQIQTQNQQPQQQQQQPQPQQHYHQQQLNETTNQFLNNQQVAVITVSSAKTSSSEVTTLSKARRINKSIVITPKAATSHRQSFATQNNFSKTQPQTQPQPPSFVSAATDDKIEFRNSTLVLRRDSITTVSSTKDSGFLYPPTPPSCSGSDSESGGYSPTRCTTVYETTTPPPLINMKKIGPIRSSTRNPIHTHLISSQPKGATGALYLTEEEKRTLISEGYAIPSKLPLTKAEEKSLKKIRRKIKNKISAQESRRKKKEYLDTLEHRVDLLTQENNAYRKKFETLQQKNQQLLQELERLQNMVNKEEKTVKRYTLKATVLS